MSDTFKYKKDLKLNARAITFRDVHIFTPVCCLPPGVWPDEADGTDVNNCSVSHNKKLLASADDYGKVNLLEYPSIHPRVRLVGTLTFVVLLGCIIILT